MVLAPFVRPRISWAATILVCKAGIAVVDSLLSRYGDPHYLGALQMITNLNPGAPLAVFIDLCSNQAHHFPFLSLADDPLAWTKGRVAEVPISIDGDGAFRHTHAIRLTAVIGFEDQVRS